MSLASLLFTRKSGNAKTGLIPVSMSVKDTCPDTCPLKQGGCYASSGPVHIHWIRLSKGASGIPFAQFCEEVKSLPVGQLWRHNQAGDLAGKNNVIDVSLLETLTAANVGRKGFTYTHKPVLNGQDSNKIVTANRHAIADANKNGFTVNLSADTLREADEMVALGIGPVVTLLPENAENVTTPAGHKVVVCPAVRGEFVTCQVCGLCAKANRKFVIGFPAHGTAKAKANKVAQS